MSCIWYLASTNEIDVKKDVVIIEDKSVDMGFLVELGKFLFLHRRQQHSRQSFDCFINILKGI